MNQFLNALDSTSWLQHIKAVIDGATFIARVNIFHDFENGICQGLSFRQLKSKRKMFLFIVPTVGIEQHSVVHYLHFFFVHTIDQSMDFE